MNLYGFVGNNSISKYDVLGLAESIITTTTTAKFSRITTNILFRVKCCNNNEPPDNSEEEGGGSGYFNRHPIEGEAGCCFFDINETHASLADLNITGIDTVIDPPGDADPLSLVDNKIRALDDLLAKFTNSPAFISQYIPKGCELVEVLKSRHSNSANSDDPANTPPHVTYEHYDAIEFRDDPEYVAPELPGHEQPAPPANPKPIRIRPLPVRPNGP